MKNICILFSLLLLLACKQEEGKKVVAAATSAVPIEIMEQGGIELPVYNFSAFEPMLEAEDDQVYIINFWATWCKPCVEELPFFEKVTELYKDKGVNVTLVSLDMPKRVEKQLLPFLKERKLQSHVVLLDDPKQNTWIPKVNENWSGAIPATVIFNKNKRLFYERSFTYEELEHELKKFIN